MIKNNAKFFLSLLTFCFGFLLFGSLTNAYALTNPPCGTAYGATFSSLNSNSANLCTSGATVMNFANNYSSYFNKPVWTWLCKSSTGTYTACYAINSSIVPVNGICGTAVRTFAYNATSYSGYTQCIKGTPSTTAFPAQGGSVSWTCSGSNGGLSSITCTARRSAAPVNGSCGTAVRTFAYSATSYSGYTQCATGTPSTTAFPAQGGSVSWTCSGSNGGSASSTCTARRSTASVNGTCGTANLKIYPYSATSYSPYTQCATGTPSTTAFPAQGSSKIWVCLGSNGGTNSNCGASRAAAPAPINGSCGTAVRTFAYNATSYSGYTQCIKGTPSTTAFPAQGGSVSWTCSGANGGSASSTCTARRSVAPINGSCGSSNNGNFVNQPTTNLCSTGTSTTPYISGTKWYWSCTGLNGGSNITCSANKTAAPVNGTCGTAVRTFTYNATSYSGYTQCGTGTPSTTAFPNQGGSVSWTCSGTNGGSASSTCIATRSAAPVNGACGTAVRTFTYNATSYSGYTQCATGTPSTNAFPAQGGSVSWTCAGSNGGSTSSTCTANRSTAPLTPVNGVCGTSDNGTFATIPTTNLCSVGTATVVSGSGPWYWTCQGTNGGTTDNCSANIVSNPINGSCGTAVRTFAYSATSYSGYTQCATGTPSTNAFPSQGGSVSWTCSGTNGGSASSTCTASRSTAPSTPVNGVCGTSDGGIFDIAPATNLCSAGTATLVDGSGPWYWTCQGSDGGTTDSCSATITPDPVNGVCGTSDGGIFDIAPATNLCSAGTASIVSGVGPWTWTCDGLNDGSSAECSADITPEPVNGVCGTSDGANLTSIPATNLCSAGTASIVSGVGPWTWTCDGLNDGTAAECSANKVVNGVCGTSDGANLTSIPATNLCSAGTASVVAGEGPWTWTCDGLNDGTAAECSANKVVNGVCGASNGGTFATAPEAGLCASGIETSPTWNGYNWAWACQSCDGGATDFCYAYRPASEVCGPANGGSFDEAPITDLCSIGFPSAVSGTGPWTWTCNDALGRLIASCSANMNIVGMSFMSVMGNNGNTCECEDNGGIVLNQSSYFSNPSQLFTSNPVVKTIGSRKINQGQSIVLKSVATDPNNLELTYYWTCTGGTLSNIKELSPTYTAHIGPNILKKNVCTLTVRNSAGGETVKTVNINIR